MTLDQLTPEQQQFVEQVALAWLRENVDFAVGEDGMIYFRKKPDVHPVDTGEAA